jgi:hypothetical protein
METLKARLRRGRSLPPRAAASSRAEETSQTTKALRVEAREAKAALDRTREAIAAVENETQANSKKLGALAEALARTRAAGDEAREHDARVAAALLELSPLGTLEAALEVAQGAASTARSTAARAEAALEGFEREMRLRQQRIQEIHSQEQLWQKRIANAREQILQNARIMMETSADLTSSRQSSRRDRGGAARQAARRDRIGRA